MCLQKTLIDKIEKSKQKIALMPNLVHSLDATSLSLLYDNFYALHKPKVSLYAIHDCFTTTADKVGSLINLLKLVYMYVYTEETCLRNFDKEIIESIKYLYGKDCKYDENKRTFIIDSTNHVFFYIEEVLDKNLPKKSFFFFFIIYFNTNIICLIYFV